MKAESIKLSHPNTQTISKYDEQKANIFWSQQFTDSFYKPESRSKESSMNSYDKSVKRVVSVSKHSSK